MSVPADRVRLLTREEVADRLGIAERTVRHWTNTGKLPAVRLSAKTVRVRESDLEALISAHLVPGASS